MDSLFQDQVLMLALGAEIAHRFAHANGGGDGTVRRLEGRLLSFLANFGKEGGPQPITTPINQEMLAEIIGATRPRVSHLMNKFRKLSFVSYNGHLQVHNSLLSVVLRDDA